jgi:Na+-translocating ferredoxin:NAD+ oxidoreductase RnfG subunit
VNPLKKINHLDIFSRHRILWLLLFLLITGSSLFAGVVSAQTVNWQMLLKQTMPEADKFTQIADLSQYKSRNLTKLAFPAYKGATQIGLILFSAPQGYGGSIYTLVALDQNGTIRKVNVFSHSETPAYVQALMDGVYQRQFEGITLADRMAFLIGQRPTKRGDIQAITGATETSKPIAIAVSEARKIFVEMYPR